MEALEINGKSLNIENFIDVARNRRRIVLSDDSEKKIVESEKTVNQLVDNGVAVYGVTTGFGSLVDKRISKDEAKQLQENLIMSHASGVGSPFNEEIIRGIMLLRVNTFAQGCSGIRLSTVEKIIDFLNNDVYPVVPEQGSVGSSGDLAPLSHLFLVLLGKGEAFIDGKVVSGSECLSIKGITPISLSYKEGLALINGTPVMTSIAAIAIHEIENLIRHSIHSSALTFEALKAQPRCLSEKIHSVRPHFGQNKTAELLRVILSGSELLSKTKIQDAYSIRATPVVIGASLDTCIYARGVIETEMNSVTDNPLIFDGEAYSGANFHGQPIALVSDFLAIAVSEIGNLAERRIFRILDPALNDGLPAFLVKNPGINSGLMIPQYAAAALVSENKILCHPASVDSIPTCANQEDHVSMGTIAARKLLPIIRNVNNVLAIEFLTAAQALDFRNEKCSSRNKEVYSNIRKIVKFIDVDREVYRDIKVLSNAISEKSLINSLSYKLEFGGTQ